MNIHEAKKMMEETSKLILIDIRDPESFKEAHIENALTFTDETLKTFVESTEKGTPLICYCYHGISSQNAAAFFRNQGFQSVYSMEGGFEAWKQVYPTVSGK